MTWLENNNSLEWINISVLVVLCITIPVWINAWGWCSFLVTFITRKRVSFRPKGWNSVAIISKWSANRKWFSSPVIWRYEFHGCLMLFIEAMLVHSFRFTSREKWVITSFDNQVFVQKKSQEITHIEPHFETMADTCWTSIRGTRPSLYSWENPFQTWPNIYRPSRFL